MDSLPNELLESVLSRIGERRDLLALRSVNKRFYAHCTSRVFGAMVFKNSPSGALQLASVASSGISQFVLDLTLDMDVSPLAADSRTYSGLVYESPEGPFSAFTNLRSLCLYFPDSYYKHEYRIRLQNILLTSIIQGVNPPTFLKIINLTPCYPAHPFTTLPAFPAFLSSLRDLKLSLSGSGIADNNHARFLDIWLSPTQPRLRTLTIRSATYVHDFPTTLDFPYLHTIALHNFFFSGLKPSSIESFIVSTQTLQHLTLSGCAIFDGAKTSYNQGTWADILARFQGTLRSLHSFRIGEALGYMKAYAFAGFGYLTLDADSTVYAREKAALENLWCNIRQSCENCQHCRQLLGHPDKPRERVLFRSGLEAGSYEYFVKTPELLFPEDAVRCRSVPWLGRWSLRGQMIRGTTFERMLGCIGAESDSVIYDIVLSDEEEDQDHEGDDDDEDGDENNGFEPDR